MARDPWDAPWQQFPASKPLRVDDGISTSKRRGGMADTWWSKRFVDVLESYGLGARMQRGRRYARAGQVMSLDVSPGLIAAQVQGSRPAPYVVTVQAPEPTAKQWSKIDDAFRSRVGFAAQLLAGDLPPELEDVFRAARVALFPATWREMRARCTCPDHENPCKHIAAVLYVFADQLDADPWLLLQWRGRTLDDILDQIRGDAGGAPAGQGLPPWWPLTPDRSPPSSEARRDGQREEWHRGATLPVLPPEPPHRVLQRLPTLRADVAGSPIEPLLEPFYAALSEPGEPEDPLATE